MKPRKIQKHPELWWDNMYEDILILHLNKAHEFISFFSKEHWLYVPRGANPRMKNNRYEFIGEIK